jgi:hypothetical protein
MSVTLDDAIMLTRLLDDLTRLVQGVVRAAYMSLAEEEPGVNGQHSQHRTL